MPQLNLLKIENTIDPPGENNNETIHVPINDSFYAIVSGGEFYFYPHETSSTEQTFQETESSCNSCHCLVSNPRYSFFKESANAGVKITFWNRVLAGCKKL